MHGGFVMSSMTDVVGSGHAGAAIAGKARADKPRAGRLGLAKGIARLIFRHVTKTRHIDSLRFKEDNLEFCWNPAGTRCVSSNKYRFPLRAKEENLQLGWNPMGNHF